MFASDRSPTLEPHTAEPRRAPRGGASRTSARRAATVAGSVLLALALAACGDTDRPWGATTASDRTAPEGDSRRAGTPPPTPDYRELTAVSPDDGREPREPGTEKPEAPSPGEVTFPRAESLYHEGAHERAARHFSVYAEKEPDNPWGHYMLGLSAWKAGELERATGALERAVELDPDHVKALVNLGRVLLERDRPEDALSRVRRALELAPDSPDALRVTGNVLAELGHPWEAVARYREALTRDPSDAWAANNFGLVLLRLGRYRDALRPLALAVELEPGQPVFRNNLGAALERTGHPGAAEEAYRAAAEAGHERARVSLARVEPLAEDGEGDPARPDLGELARSFAARVDGWRTGPAALEPEPGDEVAGTSPGTDGGRTTPPGGGEGDAGADPGDDDDPDGSGGTPGGS